MTTTDEVHLKTLMMLGPICSQQGRIAGSAALRAACTVRQQNYTVPCLGQTCGIFNNKSWETSWCTCSWWLGATNSLPYWETLSLSWRQRGGSQERSPENQFQEWLIQRPILNCPYIKLPKLSWLSLWKMKLPNLYHLMSLSIIKSKKCSVILTGIRLGTDFLL